mmetsp:Transcript_21695/g.36493  ORF Transcript_21695/g.36493 Transcript_21695/m.36493 type:complete len:179 (-) Transcript_21695:197-733(-)
MYRYFLVACGDDVTLKNKILTPVMLNQRKKLYTNMTNYTKKRLLTFKVFVQVLLELKGQSTDFLSRYKGLVAIMPGLVEFNPIRAYLLQVLDKYLLAKKQKVYERGKELLEKVSQPDEETEEEVVEESPKKHNPFAEKRKREAMLEEAEEKAREQAEAKHPKCCFCGCREKEPNLPPL